MWIFTCKTNRIICDWGDLVCRMITEIETLFWFGLGCWIVTLTCALVQKVFPSLTKIVGTLGPNSHSVEVIEECLTAGMSGLTTTSYVVTGFSAICYDNDDELMRSVYFSFFAVARFDFSWMDATDHQETLDNLRKAAQNLKKLCPVS